MMIVKVVENKPDYNRRYVQQIIGEEYNAISMNLDTGSITVYDESLGGQITLNKDEYRFIIH